MSIHVKQDWWETLFDDIYLLTDARSVCDDNITCREVDLVCELLSISKDQNILDLCGGHGRHSFELFARGYKNCTLLDYSQYLVDQAKAYAAKNNISIDIIRSDARRTKLPTESFDHVCIMGNSLGYINDNNADSLIINEANRLLCPGGKLLVDITDGDYVLKSFNPIAWHEIGDDTVVCRQRELHNGSIHAREMVLSKTNGLVRDENYSIRLYNESSIHSLLDKAGFCEIKIHKGFSAHRLKGDYGFMNNRMIATCKK
ncbi:MAG: class I SAM-dependent methyltransferase [Deltaproteobacteria bacterium]|nr:class I SAM-dependent methyltransferase [Deltaproteobacteria bacterium]